MYSICTCFLCRRAPGELEEHQQWGWVRPAGWPQLDLARPRPCCPTTSCCPTCCQHCCPGRHIAVGLPGSPSYTFQDQGWKRFLLKSLSQRKLYPKSLQRWKRAKKSAKSEQKRWQKPGTYVLAVHSFCFPWKPLLIVKIEVGINLVIIVPLITANLSVSLLLLDSGKRGRVAFLWEMMARVDEEASPALLRYSGPYIWPFPYCHSPIDLIF